MTDADIVARFGAENLAEYREVESRRRAIFSDALASGRSIEGIRRTVSMTRRMCAELMADEAAEVYASMSANITESLLEELA